MSHHQHSDLEVVPGWAPEVVPGSAPEVVPYNKENTYHTPPDRQRRICGLNPKTFWFIFGVSTVLIVGGIVGGVAGALASRNNSSSNSPDDSDDSDDSADIRASSTSPAPSSSSSSSSTTPTVSIPTVSTTTVVLPTATLLRDCPSSNGTVYDVSYGSAEPLSFRKFCTAGFRHVLNGIDLVNEPRPSLNDCINACADYNDKNKNAIASGDNQTCNAVCWRNNDQLDNINQIPGQCFAYTTLNTSSGFVVTDEVLCDSAAWINQRDL